jgi:hypothetical protein
VTKETNVHVKINLDGTGVADCSTGIHFLDHMLDVSTVCFCFFISNYGVDSLHEQNMLCGSRLWFYLGFIRSLVLLSCEG